MKSTLRFLILVCGAVGLLRADINIEWNSDVNALNRQSDGMTLIDDDFQFFLGTFRTITPTAENVSEWEGDFQVLGMANYSQEDGGRFSNATILENNTAPFTAGEQAYIWGRNGLGSGSEWFLIANDSWDWPNANPGGPPPFPVRFLLGTAPSDSVILGRFEFMDGGETVHMQSAKVEFALSYADWVAMEFPSGGDSLATDDPDLDGRTNLVEYAVGSDPNVAGGADYVIMNSDGEIVVTRAPGRAVNWVLKASTTMMNFQPVTANLDVNLDDPEKVVFRPTGTVLPKRFFIVVPELM